MAQVGPLDFKLSWSESVFVFAQKFNDHRCGEKVEQYDDSPEFTIYGLLVRYVDV